MEQHWKELLPVDRYLVKSAGVLNNEFDRNILTLLYQPLIGAKALSLYLTLWSELQQNRLWSEENTHHSIMVLQQLNLKEIYHERIKLEGIGLLNTFVNEDDETRLFIYELKPPLSPQEFFNDGMLNIYLYHLIGKNKFLKLKKFFSDEVLDMEKFKVVSKSFDHVFKSVNPKEMVSNISEEAREDLELSNGKEYFSRTSAEFPEVSESIFDFDLLISGMSEVMIPSKSLTPKVKEAIRKLSFLYDINPIEMQNIVMSAFDHMENIDIEMLRKAARDWYQFEHGNVLPTLIERTQPIPYRSMMDQQPKTKDEELMQQLEQISPKQLLTDLSGGIEPAAVDLKIIEDIMFHQKLLPGVVNVLIYYVMLKTDMKLSKAYIEKIASHWTRKNVKTVKEAMLLAREETREYQKWATQKKQTTKSKGNAQKKSVPATQVDKQEDLTEEKSQLQERVAKLKELLQSSDHQ
ncbi:replication initiation and membrane attachment family protein [Bacillus sp. PS06]|uniref:replication initiation and membrane attachment family protein n=1 Tax=Bacillus sp. PS06 TaxID=2764176 RepID=UPI0017802CC7|nr:DnaD domain protein [Bacillus sp. PS06]MBD8068931.1 DnaD domain protein [Bacillus sp. PS06]